MDGLIQEAASLKASNLVLKKAILDERSSKEAACNLLVAQKETFKRETISSLEPIAVKKDLNLILEDYHSEFLLYYKIESKAGTCDSMQSNLEFQIKTLENKTLKIDTEVTQVLHAITRNLKDKKNTLVLNSLLLNLRICWIRKILAEKGEGSHPLLASLSFVLMTLEDIGLYTQNTRGKSTILIHI